MPLPAFRKHIAQFYSSGWMEIGELRCVVLSRAMRIRNRICLLLITCVCLPTGFNSLRLVLNGWVVWTSGLSECYKSIVRLMGQVSTLVGCPLWLIGLAWSWWKCRLNLIVWLNLSRCCIHLWNMIEDSPEREVGVRIRRT